MAPFVYYTVTHHHLKWSVVLVVGAWITDVCDGWIARRYGLQTNFGAILDPLTDKIFVLVLFIALAKVGLIPWWLCILVGLRDFLLGMGGALLLGHYKKVLPAVYMGKANTFLQLCVALGALFSWPLGWLVAIMVLTMISSSLFYAYQAFRFTHGPPS